MRKFWNCVNQDKMCQSAYNAGCYRKHENDIFPVLAIKDLCDSITGDSKMADYDPEHFEVARGWDHMMIPF